MSGADERVLANQTLPERQLIKVLRIRSNGARRLWIRYYVCPYCDTPVGNRDVAMKRPEAWLHNTGQNPSTSLRAGVSSKTVTPTIIFPSARDACRFGTI